jgi:hypothetical protein
MTYAVRPIEDRYSTPPPPTRQMRESEFSMAGLCSALRPDSICTDSLCSSPISLLTIHRTVLCSSRLSCALSSLSLLSPLSGDSVTSSRLAVQRSLLSGGGGASDSLARACISIAGHASLGRGNLRQENAEVAANILSRFDQARTNCESCSLRPQLHRGIG